MTEQGVSWLLETLHVRVTAERHEAAPGSAQHAAGHGEVRDRPHVVHPVLVVGDPHRPGEDHPPPAGVEPGHALDRVPVDARAGRDLVPRDRRHVVAVRLPSLGVLPDERLVHRARLDDRLGKAGQEGDVATDVRLEVVVGDSGSEQEAADVRGNFEANEADLLQGVDHHDPAPAAPKLHDRLHEPRMVRGRVRPDQEEQVAGVDVLEDDRRRARAGDAGETHARGLVAVARAVVDV